MKITQNDLEDLRSMVHEKKELEKQIFECQCSLNITAKLSGTVVQSSEKSDQTGEIGAKLADLYAIIEDKITEIQSKLYEVENALGGLRSIDRRIIRFFYMNGYGDRRIARIMHFNEEVIGRKRRQAVEKITGEAYRNHGQVKKR